MTPSNYRGLLRPRITLLDSQTAVVVAIEWVTERSEVAWTETVRFGRHPTFVSQIVCTGDFEAVTGCFLDSEGRRHYSMPADAGDLKGVFGGKAKG